MPKRKRANSFARSKKKERKRRQKLKELRKEEGTKRKIKIDDPKKQKIVEQIVSRQIEAKRQRMKRIELLKKGKAITKASLSKLDKKDNRSSKMSKLSIFRKVMITQG